MRPHYRAMAGRVKVRALRLEAACLQDQDHRVGMAFCVFASAVVVGGGAG